MASRPRPSAVKAGFAAAALVAAAIVLASCASASTGAGHRLTPSAGRATPAPSAEPAGTPSPQPGDVVVGPADQGRQITVKVGQVITVVLTINTANGVVVSNWEPAVPRQNVPAPDRAVLDRIGPDRFRAEARGRAGLLAIRDCTSGDCPGAWRLSVIVAP
jgi:hypothetical protein